MQSNDTQFIAGPLGFLYQCLVGQLCRKAGMKTWLFGDSGCGDFSLGSCLWLHVITVLMCEHDLRMLEGGASKKGKLEQRGLCRES